MTTTTKLRRQARETLLPLALEVETAGNALETWRNEAGRKSTWSNHVKLEEIGLFGDFERAAAQLGAALAEFIPAHWAMSGWGFKCHRMGGTLTWSGKGGRARGGCQLTTQRHQLVARIAIFAGLATHGGAPTKEEAARMGALGLPRSGMTEFALYFHQRGYKLGTGASPTDVEANLSLQGEVPFSHYIGRNFATPKEAFDYGLAQADAELSRPKSWSAHPHFFARLGRDRRVRKLVGILPFTHTQSGRCSPADIEAFDRQTALALALLDELPAEPGPKKAAYLIRKSEKNDVQVEAWCPTSAVLARLLKTLFNRKVESSDIADWEVYALADEGGAVIRKIAQRFEPECEPEDGMERQT